MKKLLILLLFPFWLHAQNTNIDNNVKVYGVDSVVITGDLIANIVAPKAWAYQDSNTVATSITEDVWTLIENFTEGGENGTITFNANAITVTTTGDYEFSAKGLTVAKAAGGSAYFEFGFSINGAEPLKRHRVGRQIPGTDVGAMGFASTMSLTANDVVTLRVRNSTNSDNITVRYCEFEGIKE